MEAFSPLLLGTFLVLVRLGSMVYWLPGLASGSAPMRVRSTIVLIFTVVICMGHGGIFIEMPQQPLLIGIYMAREVVGVDPVQPLGALVPSRTPTGSRR